MFKVNALFYDFMNTSFAAYFFFNNKSINKKLTISLNRGA